MAASLSPLRQIVLLAAVFLAPAASSAAPADKAPGKTAPGVVPGTAEVKGGLDKELIRRVVRRHLGEVNACYSKELARNPALQGRVMVQFIIAASGSVKEAKTQSSTLGSPAVEDCIVAALKSWEFPKPSPSGDVVVTYPFVLKLQGE